MSALRNAAVGLVTLLRSELELRIISPSLEAAADELDQAINESITAPEPIPMRLTCPDCGQLHIDEGEWATRVHAAHSCQHCGLTWRPAVVPTVGVRFLPGFKNETKETTKS